MTHTPALLSAAELADLLDLLRNDYNAVRRLEAANAVKSHIDALSAPAKPKSVGFVEALQASGLDKLDLSDTTAPVGSEEVREILRELSEARPATDISSTQPFVPVTPKMVENIASLLRRLTAPVADAELADRVRELRGVKLSEKASDDLVRWHWQSLKVCELAEKIARERDEAKAVLVRVADDLTCPRPHGAHYCSACDNSLFNLKAAVYAAIGRKEAEDTDDE